MNKQIRIWICKRLLKHIENMELNLPKYKEQLRTHLKALPVGDFFLFCIDTGYPESVLKQELNEE